MEENKELKVEDGAFIDKEICSVEMPSFTDEEADDYKEQENVKLVQEGGL